MTKYHINRQGIPAVCRAKTRPCPLGGEDQHFESKEDAQKFADTEMSKTHGLMPSEKVEYSREELETLYKSSKVKDRIKAVENGFDDYSIVKDKSPLVKLAAIQKGFHTDSLRYDKNEEVAERALEEYYKTPDGKLNKLFNELVPPMGRAESEAGELVRAANRIIYRYFNDGDRVGVGYGNETCNGTYRYLHTKANKMPDRKLTNILENLGDPGIDDKRYEENLEKLTVLIGDYVEKNPSLKTKLNTVDSREDFFKPSDNDWDDGDDPRDAGMYGEDDEYDDRYPGFDSGYGAYNEDEYDENGEDGNGYMY